MHQNTVYTKKEDFSSFFYLRLSTKRLAKIKKRDYQVQKDLNKKQIRR